MFGKKRRAKEKAALQQQSNQAADLAAAGAKNLYEPSPVETAKAKDYGDFQAALHDSGDITDPRLGLGPHLNLFNRAKEHNYRDAANHGAFTFGSYAAGQTPGGAALLGAVDKETQAEEEQAAGGALEDAFNRRNAEVQGTGSEVLDADLRRRLAATQALQGVGGLRLSALEEFTRRPPGTWQQLMNSFAQGAGQKAAAGCTTLDTLVLTPSGYIPVGEIAMGDLVIGFTKDGRRVPLPVERIRLTENSPVLKVRLANGLILHCSPSHRLLIATDDRTETPVSKLGVGARVLVANGSLTTIAEVAGGPPQTVCILKLAGENVAYDTAGILSLDDYT